MISSSISIKISEAESRLMGICFARGRANAQWQPDEITTQIAMQNIDLLRIKFDANDPLLFQKLQQTQIPYSIHSIILRNRVVVNSPQQLPPDMVFEIYDGSQTLLLQQLFTESLQNPTHTSFTDLDLQQFFNEQNTLAAATDYVLQFNHTQHPNNFGWIMKKDSQAIGFVMGTVHHNFFEGTFYGIAKAHRGSGVYPNLIHKFIINYCLQQGLQYFENDVPFQNFLSLRALFDENVLPFEAYLNIHLKPFVLKKQNTFLYAT